jgi:hypothetical protein
MSIENYVYAFAELLEKGGLIAQEDPTKNVGLKAEDHPMHVVLANILRKSLKSGVMASVADDFHVAFNAVTNERNALTEQIKSLTTQLDALAAKPAAEPIEGEFIPAAAGVDK